MNTLPQPASRRAAFTLVELLVVIGVIAILISILLPALTKARDTAATIKCAANLRSIGQGLAAYAATSEGYLPSAYDYRNSTIDASTGQQTPASPTWGYVHWSSYLHGTCPPDAFQCPSIPRGGLPAADPPLGVGNFDSNQSTESANTGSPADPDNRVTAITQNGKTYFPDDQAPRMAYTLNEALCGRNKYVVGFQGCTRIYRPVRIGQVDNSSGTILATEFVSEWGIVSGVVDDGSSPAVCKSHRPVQPFRADGGGGGDASGASVCDVSTVAASTLLRRTNAKDLYVRFDSTQSLDPINDFQTGQYGAASRSTRLDWVGRNHDRGKFYVDNKTNFLYADGHVETKSILQTVPRDSSTKIPWEWGERPYSINPNGLAP